MISKNNAKVQTVISKIQKGQLRQIAKSYKWTISKLVAAIIEKFLEDRK